MSLDPNIQNRSTDTRPAARPSATAAIETANLVSSFDVYKPEKLNTLFKVRGMQGLSYMLMLRAIGFELQVAQGQYGHHEDDYTHETFRVKTQTAAGAAGAAVDMVIMNGAGGDISTVGTFFVRLGDEITLPDLRTQVRVQKIVVSGSTGTINATVTVTLVPKGANDIIPILRAGQELAITSASFAEGTTQPKGLVRKTLEYVNFTQIIKETMRVTGTALTNQLWFDNATDGQGIPAYYIKGQADTDYSAQLKVDGALMWGQLTTNTLITDTNSTSTGTGYDTDDVAGQFNTTEGLVPYIRRTGHTLAYPTGQWSVNQFDSIGLILDKEFAGDYLLAMLGINLLKDNENALVDYFKMTDISYVKSEMDNYLYKGNQAMSEEEGGGGITGLSMAVGFRYFRKLNRTFCLHKMGMFSHPKLYGAPGYATPGYGIVVPIKKGKDKLTQNEVPSIGMRYKSMNGYNRRATVWNQSGAGNGLLTIPQDIHNHYLRMDIGAHHIGGNNDILLQPV